MINRNIFLNCPYDDKYRILLNLQIYMIYKFGYKPQLSCIKLDKDDRMTKILEIIKDCKIGFHDISMMKFDGDCSYARFNMPFELGINYAYKKYINMDYILLIMDSEPYLSKKAISDLNGIDTFPHKNNPEELIKIIRDFFIRVDKLKGVKYQGAIMIEYQTSFEYWLKVKLQELGFPERYLSRDISVIDYVSYVEEFFQSNRSLLVNDYK